MPFQRILQYDINCSVVLLNGGLCRGSCGAPYVAHSGQVVAMHLESIHQDKNTSIDKPKSWTKKKQSITEVEDVVDHLESAKTTDMSAVHCSIRQGVVLANIAQLLAFIEAENAP
mmetsp:Transcript_12310/g.16903  ORF Transcript_12310/g.16903 Transcript_12310/m.16903 type:complete len:115 (+) Transcript_12310:478-822(+)